MGVEPTPVKNRSIDTIRVQTPLIVPSFSSRGFPAIRDIYEALISKLYGVCLVSSWDLRKGYLPPHAVTDTDVVIVDSRGYENDSLLAVTHPIFGCAARPQLGP